MLQRIIYLIGFFKASRLRTNACSTCRNTLVTQNPEINTLAQKIIQHHPAKKIYLLGSTREKKGTETIFSVPTEGIASTKYYFALALIEKSKDATLSIVQDKYENNLLHWIPSTVMVMYFDDFAQWLNNGHYFAKSVIEKATLIYEDDDTALPSPALVNEDLRKKANELLHSQTLYKVESFLAGAELFRSREEYKLSVFMLHQAAEQCLRAMLIITIGLRVISHNIDKMLRYACMYASEAAGIFSKENKGNKRLLKLLNTAYLDARYREDNYNITLEELERLAEKVKTIKRLFEKHRP